MVKGAPTGSGTFESESDVRIGRILNDYLDRHARGEPITAAALLAEHPDIAEVLAGHLTLLQVMAPSSNAIQELLSRRVLTPSASPGHVAELGIYRVQGVIGRGGMGIVLRAIEAPLNRPVALKILRPELAVDERALVRFEHEAKAVAALRHPNIVTVHACGTQDGTPFLAMELIDGPSLAEVLCGGGDLGAEEVRRIFRELLRGLSAAHAAGLVHRDIKSSNILLDGKERRVKIADFGLARMTASNTRITLPQAAIGTPEYMSPEQARGDEDVDHRTDLYSAGVVLYEMLTGRVPFRGETPSALVYSILSVDPPSPRSLRQHADRHLSRLALRLLAKRREDRFRDAEAALGALDHGGRFPLWEQRRRLGRRLIVGAVGLAAVVSVGLFARSAFRDRLLAARPEIREVRVGEASDDRVSKKILASYGDESAWKVFLDLAQDRRFPSKDDGVYSARLWRDVASHAQTVLATVAGPPEVRGLVAFDSLGRRRWNLEITDRTGWPDCEGFGGWMCTDVAFLDQDSRLAVVLARDRSVYPTCIAVVDLAARQVFSRFYHTGQLKPPLVVPDYFGPNRPAIVAWGLNNKLDGFEKPQDGDAMPRSNYEYVPVVMILDPDRMAGIGPPRSRRFPDLAQAEPYAYAFLELSGLRHNAYRAPGETKYVSVDAERSATIEGVDVLMEQLVGAPPRPTLAIHTNRIHLDGEEYSGGVQILVDSELSIVGLIPTTYERVRDKREFWDPLWRVLVRRYEDVESWPDTDGTSRQ